MPTKKQKPKQKVGFFRRVISLLSSRLVLVAIVVILQALLLIAMIFYLSSYSTWLNLAFTVFSILVIFYIINNSDSPEYKIAWIIPILVFPVFGGLLYIFLGGNKSATPLLRKMQKELDESSSALEQDHGTYKKLTEDVDGQRACESAYLLHGGGYPVYNNTKTEYFTFGQAFFPKVLEDLRNAKQYIFMEFFIIEEGIMWDTILSILKEKATEGVDICFMYDDVGSLFTLPSNYPKQLQSYGIRCEKFNPLDGRATLRLNNRDHRKIIVIDGNVGYTGGANLADEYINAFEKHGYWKDTMIRLEGDAVYSLTVMFLRTWNTVVHENERVQTEDYSAFFPTVLPPESECTGFYQPYGGGPIPQEPISESSYRNMINRATDYIYIMTPYLILNQEMVGALELAAKSGVDVRIITPHVPDKKMVFEVTQSYYPRLLKAGVRIFEYTPGFIHAKTIVVDGKAAVVGTINFDYRSLYLHFECGVWMYGTPLISEMKQDYMATQAVSQEVTLSSYKVSVPRQLMRSVLQTFAPMM